MQLTKNFRFEEFYASDTAKKKKINNLPSIETAICITRLADNVMQKIRDRFKTPVIITSGFRCAYLNKCVGGAVNSQHTKGEAVDFVVKGHCCEEVFLWCKNNLIFDQLISEKGQWIHISYNHFKNRKEALRFDGKKYTKA